MRDKFARQPTQSQSNINFRHMEKKKNILEIVVSKWDK